MCMHLPLDSELTVKDYKQSVLNSVPKDCLQYLYTTCFNTYIFIKKNLPRSNFGNIDSLGAIIYMYLVTLRIEPELLSYISVTWSPVLLQFASSRRVQRQPQIRHRFLNPALRAEAFWKM